MLQAWISSSRGSLYFAAEATPYNLEHLRTHVRGLCRGSAQSCLALSLGGGDDRIAVAAVAQFAQELTREGIPVRFSAAVEQATASSASSTVRPRVRAAASMVARSPS